MSVDGRDNFGDSPNFFVGVEVEHTPMFGERTLFVIGKHNPKEILARALNQQCKHIYLGAGYTFEPKEDDWNEWDFIIGTLLSAGGVWVTLDYDVKYHEGVLESGWNEDNRFISMISVKLPYIEQLNYNATLKLDDKAFKGTNSGVWCHQIHELQDRSKYSDWDKYVGDKVIE